PEALDGRRTHRATAVRAHAAPGERRAHRTRADQRRARRAALPPRPARIRAVLRQRRPPHFAHLRATQSGEAAPHRGARRDARAVTRIDPPTAETTACLSSRLPTAPRS